MDEKERPLTDEELREIRSIIEHDKRWKWLATVLRSVGAWLAVVIGGFVLFWETLVSAIRGGGQ